MSESYDEYLKSDYWKTVVKAVKARADYRCQVCDSPHDLQAHHRTYKNRGEELDHLGDLICLCRRCHAIFHGVSKSNPYSSPEYRPSKRKEHKKRQRTQPKIDVESEMPEGNGDIVLTHELINNTRANGSFTNATLRAFGLHAPLVSGWIARLAGTTIDRNTYRNALIGRNWYNSGPLEKE